MIHAATTARITSPLQLNRPVRVTADNFTQLHLALLSRGVCGRPTETETDDADGRGVCFMTKRPNHPVPQTHSGSRRSSARVGRTASLYKLAGPSGPAFLPDHWMKKPEPIITVSDHALVRFIERKFSIDLTPVRKELVAMARGPAVAGATNFKTPMGTFCFKRADDGRRVVISTFLEPHMRSNKAGRG